ncbi:WD repeat-containing protein ATCSA-1 [Clonorchis sinensis]|uniref:WD repeat-containing protein ATCSA-1 n=1 Tax=Clonorchis sinensis TaxID=79923 RepID=A0A8T1M9T7_CLOSI|nr:WD repeat-containing protein ATCSA-1 [Clonorchis sinensis]
MFSSNYMKHELRWKIEQFRGLYHLPRMLQLDVDYDIVFSCSAVGAINDLCLDELDTRYLLAGYQDGSIVLFDMDATSDVDGQQIYQQLARIDKCPTLQHSTRRFRNELSPLVCIQWYPVDTGAFFTASLDKTVRVWDTNRLECVDVVELPASVSWIDLSKCATTHNLVAAALGSSEDGRAVLIDPIIGATALTLSGGHSPSGLSQVLWSIRSPHVVITGGHDGRVLFWDIRVTSKPVCSLDKYGDPSGSPYSSEATAHTGSVLSLSFATDGLHLFSWGGAGASEDALCLRMWSCSPDGISDGVFVDETRQLRWPQLRPVNFGTIYMDAVRTSGQNTSTSRVNTDQGQARAFSSEPRSRTIVPLRSRPKETPVRMAVASGASGTAWGAQASIVYAPCRSRIFLAMAEKYHASTRLVNRHYNRVRACVWNGKKQELYTCGMDGNLLAWPILTNPTTDIDEPSE